MAVKPTGYGAGNKTTLADDASGLSGLPASTGLTGQVPQANGGLGVDASALSDGVLVKSGGVISSAAPLPTASGGTNATAYTANGVVVADGAGTALQSTNTPTTPGQFLLWDGAQWLPGIQTGTVYYFRRDASDIGGGYEQITQSPQTGAEKTDSTTLNNASGTVVFDLYASNAGEPGLTQLLAGTWEFDIYGQVSSTAGGNTTNLVLQVYKRTTGGTETLLFSTTSPALDSTSVKLYSWLYTQPADIPLDVTDRLVVKVAATNSHASNRTVTFYYEGTTHYSHFHPPFLSLIDGTSLVTIGGTQTITGAKTFSVAPVMSGANITAATIPAGKIQGGVVNRFMIDDGVGGTWTNTLLGATISGALNTLVSIPAATALTGQVPVANGGTAKATWTVGSIPVATAGTVIGEIAPGTAGHVLTSNGPGVAPTMQAPAGATTASAVLSGTYVVASTSYVNIGLSLPLGPGNWRLGADIRNLVITSANNGFARLRFYNATAAAVVANSETQGFVSATTGQPYGGTTSITGIDITLAVPSTIEVQAAQDAVASYTTLQILSDGTDGRSRFYAKTN